MVSLLGKIATRRRGGRSNGNKNNGGAGTQPRNGTGVGGSGGSSPISVAVEFVSWFLDIKKYRYVPFFLSPEFGVDTNIGRQVAVAAVTVAAFGGGCDMFVRAMCAVRGVYEQHCSENVVPLVALVRLRRMGCDVYQSETLSEFLNRTEVKKFLKWIRWAINDTSVVASEEISRWFDEGYRYATRYDVRTFLSEVTDMVMSGGTDRDGMRKLLGVAGIHNTLRLLGLIERFGEDGIARGAAIAAMRLKSVRSMAEYYEPVSVLERAKNFGENFARLLREEYDALVSSLSE